MPEFADGNLQRFVDAQKPVYQRVLAELRAGEKTSHWMWFIFPQIQGLGASPTAIRFAISGRAEGQAYLQHPLLGPRLRECTELVNAIVGKDVDQVFGFPDDLKFRSSMTLFHECSGGEEVFEQALEKYFDGEPDSKTLQLLTQTWSEWE